MSDCSTNAMKPKENAKTCRTCAKAVPILCPPRTCDRAESIDAQFGGISCAKWQKRINNVEQRYQQLEQVARDMYESIKNSCDGKTSCWPCDKLEFASRLEALGVSVDD